MGFLGDFGATAGLCIGTIAVIIILIAAASFVLDLDTRTSIENNKTIELNGVEITVPETTNYSINENESLWNYNDTEKFGYNSNITAGNAVQYYDYVNKVNIYVADANRTAYSDVPDFSELETFDGELERTHIEKKNVGDKVVYMYVTEGKGLSKLIIDSAVHV